MIPSKFLKVSENISTECFSLSQTFIVNFFWNFKNCPSRSNRRWRFTGDDYWTQRVWN